jgi:hypothetical protein
VPSRSGAIGAPNRALRLVQDNITVTLQMTTMSRSRSEIAGSYQIPRNPLRARKGKPAKEFDQWTM